MYIQLQYDRGDNNHYTTHDKYGLDRSTGIHSNMNKPECIIYTDIYI
jgi:hypothetical protein